MPDNGEKSATWQMVRQSEKQAHGFDAYTLLPLKAVIIGIGPGEARLIEAAPKMLAALEKCLAHLPQSSRSPYKQGQVEAAQYARSVIEEVLLGSSRAELDTDKLQLPSPSEVIANPKAYLPDLREKSTIEAELERGNGQPESNPDGGYEPDRNRNLPDESRLSLPTHRGRGGRGR